MEHIDISKDNNKDRIRKAIEAKIKEIKGYTPKIGVWGISGVGKSSLCNALFGSDIAHVSHVKTGTTEIQEIHLKSQSEDGGGIIIVDFPGIDDMERNEEYINLYKEKANDLDVVVWAIQGRGNASALKTFQEVLLKNIKNRPVVFAITQIDNIGPKKDSQGNLYWVRNEPTGEQLENVYKSVDAISTYFNVPPERVVPTSSEEGYNISRLMEVIIDVIPNAKKYGFYRETRENVKTDQMAEKAEKGVWDSVKEWAGEAWDSVKDIVVETAAATLIAVGSKLLSKIKFW